MVFLYPKEKQSVIPEHTGKIIRKTDFWAYRLAEEIVHEAFQRHQSIVHASETAFLEEKARGYREGMEISQLKKSEIMLDVINKTVSYSMTVEQQFSLLVFNAVKQIIGEFSDKDRALSVVRSAMAAMRGQKHIILKVNPENIAAIETELKNLQKLFPSVTHIEIFSQNNLSLDSCVVSTEIGSAEANIHGQLEALRKSLSKVFGAVKDLDQTLMLP